MGETDTPAFPHRIGRVIRAHGLRGEVMIQLFRARPIEPHQLKFTRDPNPRSVELCFEDGRDIAYRVMGMRYTSPSSFIASLDGVEDRASADLLVGAFFDVDPRDAPTALLDEVDPFFGARVVDVESGAELGTIDDIRDNGAQPVLVVGDEEILIPWVEAFIDSVDDGPDPVVRVRPIPGLLEANAPKPEADPSEDEGARR